MEAMLDEPLPLSTTGNAPGEFLVGKIPSKDGAYHVVILARCDVAENLAATNATILFERFPQLDRVLVVGIAGAAPDPTKPENDVHLGDIVVSNEVGVIQYDYEKEILRGEAEVIHESRHPPRPPSARLLSAAKDLEVQDLKGESRWEANTARARLPWTDRPAFPDELHALDDPTEILSRSADPRRRPSSPRVIFGPIASANKLLKNARVRERLRKSFGVKAVEMEAAGVADAAWAQGAGFFIIRGICDYCDEFKADHWQGYAALIAAAYARALLEATRAAADAAHRSRKSADYPILGSLPEKARQSLNALAEQVERGEDLVAGLAELVEIEQTLPTHVNMAWPRKVPWALSVVATVSDLLGIAKLSHGETLACLALPFVSSAIQQLWSTDRLLSDFGHFDPRVCHSVNMAISSGDRKVDLVVLEPDRFRLKEYELQHARRAFFPAESRGGTPEKATKLQQLWEIARKMPDARQLAAFVLEDRRVAYEFRRHLRNIPDVLWEAWQQIELGVPESAALEYGGLRATSEALPLYMSWLSGLSPKECQGLLIRLAELFDLRWDLPSRNAVDCSAVTDYESWLLSHGRRTRRWLGPDIEALDVILFSEHSGRSLSDSVREYQSMAARLGFPSHWDEELASKLGQLSDDERSFAVDVREGWHDWLPDSMTHERGSLIAAAARLPPPAKKGNPIGKLFGPESKLGSTEAENLVIRQIRSAIHAPNYRVDLAVLCQVATALGKEKQITEMAERVRSAAKILGHDVSYGEDGISAAREFDDTDWILIRDRPPHALAIHGQVGAMTRQRLITRISSNPYYFYKHDGRDWHRRLSELYALFGWGEPPLTLQDIKKALELPREAAALVGQAPSDGVLSIGALIIVTATDDVPFHAMNAAFEPLAPLGFRGPTEDDTYIGISWAEMSRHT